MKRRIWFTALVILSLIVALLSGFGVPTIAQQEPVPIAPLPGSATEYKPPTPSPSVTPIAPINPTAAPTAAPTGSPTSSPTGVPIPAPPPNLPPMQIPPPPLPAAEPLPTAGEYQDPNGRFRVAILQGFRRTRMAGTEMLEARDGSLAYTVVAQPAPAAYVTPDMLAEMARNTFKQGEGFRPGQPQPIAGGMRLDWSGELTVGGQTQPVSGLIVAKNTGNNVLLMLIAATEKGGNVMPNAAAALIDSLQ